MNNDWVFVDDPIPSNRADAIPSNRAAGSYERVCRCGMGTGTYFEVEMRIMITGVGRYI